MINNSRGKLIFSDKKYKIYQKGIEFKIINLLYSKYIPFNEIMKIYDIRGLYTKRNDPIWILFHYKPKKISMFNMRLRIIRGSVGNVISFYMHEKKKNVLLNTIKTIYPKIKICKTNRGLIIETVDLFDGNKLKELRRKTGIDEKDYVQ